ncbi:ribose 5-phosphate isomerase B [Pedomonas sp. V897]|uniref:ribose 5-phosphate isomerase B n=1 Tax=Pedomonas sp. V897 TaxID=3446482 RepID=UPI003EE259F6
MTKTVAIGSDHAGVKLKQILMDDLHEAGFNVLDLGTCGSESVDYPDFGYAVATAVAEGKAERGVVICGSGIGISIAANRIPAVRAALCTNGLMARLARQHNDANVLAIGERLTGVDMARDILKEFLATPFDGGRHQRRIDKLSNPPVRTQGE